MEPSSSSSLNFNSADMDFLHTRCNLILHQRMIGDVKQSLAAVKKRVHETELTLNMKPPDFDEQEMEVWTKKVDTLVNYKSTIAFPKFRDIRKEIRQENEEAQNKIRREKEETRLLLLPGRMRYKASLDSVRTSKADFKTEVADKMKKITFGEPTKGDVIRIIDNYKGSNTMIQGDTRVLVRKSRNKGAFEQETGLPTWMGVGYYSNVDPSYLKDKSEVRYKIPFYEHQGRSSQELREEKMKSTERNKLYRHMSSLPAFMGSSSCDRPHSREDFVDPNDVSPWSLQSAKSSIGLPSPLSSRGNPIKNIVGPRSISRENRGKITNQFRDMEYSTRKEFDPNADDLSASVSASVCSRANSKRSTGTGRSDGNSSNSSTIIRRQTPEAPKTYGKSYLMEKTLEGRNAVVEQTSYEPWRRDYTLGALQLQNRISSAKRASANGRSREQFNDGRDEAFVSDEVIVKRKDDGDEMSVASSESLVGQPAHLESFGKSVLSENSFHLKLTKDFVNYQNHIKRHNGFLKPKVLKKKVKSKPPSTDDDANKKQIVAKAYDDEVEAEIDAKNDDFIRKLNDKIKNCIEERDLQLEALKDLGMKEGEYNTAVAQCTEFNQMRLGPMQKELEIFVRDDEYRRETRRLVKEEEARRDAERFKADEEARIKALQEETFTGDVEDLRKRTSTTQLQKSLQKQSANIIRSKSEKVYNISPPKMTITAKEPPLHVNIDRHLADWFEENEVYLPKEPKTLHYRNFPESINGVNLNGILIDERKINERLFKVAMADAEIIAQIEKSADITPLLKKKSNSRSKAGLISIEEVGGGSGDPAGISLEAADMDNSDMGDLSSDDDESFGDV